jgi:hypothetical protein
MATSGAQQRGCGIRSSPVQPRSSVRVGVAELVTAEVVSSSTPISVASGCPVRLPSTHVESSKAALAQLKEMQTNRWGRAQEGTNYRQIRGRATQPGASCSAASRDAPPTQSRPGSDPAPHRSNCVPIAPPHRLLMPMPRM